MFLKMLFKINKKAINGSLRKADNQGSHLYMREVLVMTTEFLEIKCANTDKGSIWLH